MQNDTTLPKTLPAFFWHFVRPYCWYFIVLLTTGVLWGFLTSATPYTLKLLIDKLAGVSNLPLDAMQLFAIYMALWIWQACNHRLVDWIWLRMLPNIRRDIINSMYGYLSGHSYNFFQNNFAGSLQNKISDITGGSVSILRKIDDGFAQVVGLIIAFSAMLFVHPSFAFLLFGWAVAFLSVGFFFSKKIHKLSHDFSSSRTSMIGKIVDGISNMIIVRSFARRSFEHKYLDKAVNDTVEKDRKVQRSILFMHIGFDITILTMIGLMVWNLIYLHGTGDVTIGDFAFIMMLVVNIFMALWWLVSQLVEFAEELGKCSQALTIITTAHEIVDVSDAKQLSVTEGQIKFDNVTFHYNKDTNVFENKDVAIEAGQKVGLIGFSGSGKTTFVNLILRFFDVESGKIMIDGQNITEVTQDSLRENISMIPQDTSLFHRSLMDNIRYGKIDASDEEVIEASKQAHCHEFIEKLPERYEALVGERGIKLSGGQRQRIAIARAMLKDAPILILDEATSALDSVTEKHIQESLHSLMKGRTTIVIAHRLSTLSEMDRILVFDKGHIIEDGSHEKLLKNKGHYARMWKMQAGGFLPEVEDE
ncbi:MAG: ABC transporter ATP-binding protein [Proteobacteria bacterium]|nr:ABC transporter ATP-binding protein [Pseudomonadota bacterium]